MNIVNSYKNLKTLILSIAIFSGTLYNTLWQNTKYIYKTNNFEKEAWYIHKLWALENFSHIKKWEFLSKLWNSEAIKINLEYKQWEFASNIMINKSQTYNPNNHYNSPIAYFKRIGAWNSQETPESNPKRFSRINAEKKKFWNWNIKYPEDIYKYKLQWYKIITFIKRWNIKWTNWWYEEIFYFVLDK